MSNLTDGELAHLEDVVEKLNEESTLVKYELVDIRGTYYIFPQLTAES